MRILHCLIVTPIDTTFAGEVEEVIAPLPDGWLGILPRHAPFVARLMRGHVVIREAGRRRTAATVGGMLLVDGDTVTILTGASGLDMDIAGLEREIGAELVQVEALEREAEKYFDRTYRQLARTLHPHREIER